MSGKGSAPRPFSVKDDVFAENYCMTFGHKFRAGRCMNCGVDGVVSGFPSGGGEPFKSGDAFEFYASNSLLEDFNRG